MNELKILNEDISYLYRQLKEEKLTPNDIKVLFSYLTTDEINKSGIFTKIRNLTNKITSSDGYASLKLKLSKSPQYAKTVKDKIEMMYNDMLPYVQQTKGDIQQKLNALYSKRHNNDYIPYLYSIMSLVSKNYKNGEDNKANAIILTSNDTIDSDDLNKTDIKSVLDDSVDIIQSKYISPKHKEQLETLYDMAYGNESNEKYLNSFFDALSKQSDSQKNMYVHKWFDHVKNRLKQSHSVSESQLFENKFKRFGQKIGLLDKEKFDYNSLIRKWRELGYPDDTEELYDMLSDLGFSKRDINKSFSRIGLDISNTIDSSIVNLSKFIKKNNLENYVINYIDKYHMPKTWTGKRKFYVPETMVVIKKSIINSIFEDITNVNTNGISNQHSINAIYQLAKQLKEVPDKQDKMFLIHDILEYLKDNQDHRDFSNVIGSMASLFASQKDVVPINYIKAALDSLRDLNETISAGCISESEYKVLEFLGEVCNIDLSELNCSLIESNGQYKYDLTLIDSDVSISTVIENLQNAHTYGRAKKCL